MMKIRSLGISVVFLIALFLNFGNAYAIGIIDLDATVNPNYGGSFSGLGDTTGTAEYRLGIDPASFYGADYFALVSEDDIFASVVNLTVLSAPAGWSLSLGLSGPHMLLTADGIGSLDLLDPGEAIRLTLDYELTDTYAYFNGTDPNNTPPLWAWTQDGPDAWNQSVSAILTSGGPIPTAMGGGSTTTVPEPGTLLLLGLGLVGVAVYYRRKKAM